MQIWALTYGIKCGLFLLLLHDTENPVGPLNSNCIVRQVIICVHHLRLSHCQAASVCGTYLDTYVFDGFRMIFANLFATGNAEDAQGSG